MINTNKDQATSHQTTMNRPVRTLRNGGRTVRYFSAMAWNFHAIFHHHVGNLTSKKSAIRMKKPNRNRTETAIFRENRTETDRLLRIQNYHSTTKLIRMFSLSA